MIILYAQTNTSLSLRVYQLNQQPDLKGQHSFNTCSALLTSGGPCHLSSLKKKKPTKNSLLGTERRLKKNSSHDVVHFVNIKKFWVWISSPCSFKRQGLTLFFQNVSAPSLDHDWCQFMCYNRHRPRFLGNFRGLLPARWHTLPLGRRGPQRLPCPQKKNKKKKTRFFYSWIDISVHSHIHYSPEWPFSEVLQPASTKPK